MFQYVFSSIGPQLVKNILNSTQKIIRLSLRKTDENFVFCKYDPDIINDALSKSKIKTALVQLAFLQT